MICFKELFSNGSGDGEEEDRFFSSVDDIKLYTNSLLGSCFFILLLFATTLNTLTGVVNAIKCNARGQSNDLKHLLQGSRQI